MRVESGRHAVLRVVIDTNVWISAALSRAGPPAQVVRHVLQAGVPVLCEETFAELEARLWRPKFDRYLSMERRRSILHDLSAAAHWVTLTPEISARRFCLRDPDDDKFIHAALAAEAAWLVTGDLDLLGLAPLPGVHILSPAEALQRAEFGG